MRAPLLQSWGYGEVQAAEGWSRERVVLGRTSATVLVAGRGRARWAYVPRGPVPADAGALDELAAWARDVGLARLRVEPDGPPDLAAALRERGFRPAPALQPAHTLIVPLAGEEATLAGFKPKHRYNVRLALKRGVEVAIEDDPAELDRQHAETAARQRISAAARAAYERRLERLPECHVYVARHEGRPLAAIMVARFDRRAYYLFGGSSGERRELMPTYAVQWTAMVDAMRAGCDEYDLWGVPPDEDPAHPWHGLWQFKTGFGGRMVAYAGAWDLPLDTAGHLFLVAREGIRRGARRVAGLRNIR
jgi:lipid II:glycine glycyltransferase (peptidoglycan interpeptide bridge formation enzyme)